MENSILIDWGDRPDTRPAVKVRTCRAMLLRPVGGQLTHTEAGSEITLDPADLDRLDPADYELAPAD